MLLARQQRDLVVGAPQEGPRTELRPEAVWELNVRLLDRPAVHAKREPPTRHVNLHHDLDGASRRQLGERGRDADVAERALLLAELGKEAAVRQMQPPLCRGLALLFAVRSSRHADHDALAASAHEEGKGVDAADDGRANRAASPSIETVRDLQLLRIHLDRHGLHVEIEPPRRTHRELLKAEQQAASPRLELVDRSIEIALPLGNHAQMLKPMLE